MMCKRLYAEFLRLAVDEQAKADEATMAGDDAHLIAAHMQRAAYYRSKAEEVLGEDDAE